MKKCASCSKDLPEAALHCVFCGAKQAAVPAVSPGLAKTAFGYSANEVMQQLGNPPPQQQPYQPPQQPYQPPQQQYQEPPRAHSPSQPQYQEPPRAHSPSQPGPGAYGAAQPAAANAKTVMVQGPAPGMPYQPPQQQYQPPQQQYQPPQQQGYGAPQQGYGAPQQQGYGAPQQGYGAPAPGMGIHSPPQPTPQPLPTAQPAPYMGARTGAAGRPIEPYKDALRTMMIVWGALTLAAFLTPIMVDPMVFHWDAITDAPGKLKIPSLLMVAIGGLSLGLAFAPMQTLQRGILAASLGLAGIIVPIAAGLPFDLTAMAGGGGRGGGELQWQKLLPMVGMLVMVPGLLVRHEYTESMLSRVMVTIGAVAVLIPFLVPEHGNIPLVFLFKMLIEAPGEYKLIAMMGLAVIVLVVLALLAWMPGPATAGARPIAWALILYPVAVFAIALIMAGKIDKLISKSPGALMMWAPAVAYSVLSGYGLATVIGKKLE